MQKARSEGYRSRAVYKLEEILDKYSLLKPGMTCVDLGAAPGSFSEILASRLKGRGRVIAVDVLEMNPVPGVEFIQGDFTEQTVLEQLLAALGDGGADLVISDMAPNMSGTKAVDQPRAMYLAELALDLARRTLGRGGSLVCKVFQGEGIDAYVADARGSFAAVKLMKPKASRPGSSEMYLVARNYQL